MSDRNYIATTLIRHAPLNRYGESMAALDRLEAEAVTAERARITAAVEEGWDTWTRREARAAVIAIVNRTKEK